MPIWQFFFHELDKALDPLQIISPHRVMLNIARTDVF
jgi:hypothetical protein